jgi:tRNA A37 threonylcarbamoyladenosine dehydratase
MRFNRLINLIGQEKFLELQSKQVIIFGLGGVGSFAAEAIARSGIMKMTVVDYDFVDITNINRQLVALESTIGQLKVDVFKKRALDINPLLSIEALNLKVTEENISSILSKPYDFVIDCIDDVTAKVAIAKFCLDNDLKLITSAGFANKSNPQMIKVAKLNQTKVCPLAKTLRYKLKSLGYPLKIDVVYSEEQPLKVIDKSILGSNAYVPPAAGLIIAAHVINNLIGEEEK